MLIGKSSPANMMAMKMYQPSRHVKKQNAPPAICIFPAYARVAAFGVAVAYAIARYQYAAAKKLKAKTRVKKIKKKTMLVRNARIMYTKHKTPIQSKKNAKLALNVLVVRPSAGADGSGEYAP